MRHSRVGVGTTLGPVVRKPLVRDGMWIRPRWVDRQQVVEKRTVGGLGLGV